MSSLLPHPVVSVSWIACGIAGFAAAITMVIKLYQPSKLDDIPTVGSSSWLGSWWAGLTYLTNAPDIIQEGYGKSVPFKVAELCHWVVVFSSPKHVEEIRRAPDDILSFAQAANEQVNINYSMGPEIINNPYHLPIVRARLTRNISALYPEIIDEISTAFDDVLDLRGNEWKSILALSNVQKVACRTINRVFVGLPLSRDPDWIGLSINYSVDVITGAVIIRLFPDWLKPTAIRLFTCIEKSRKRGREFLGPIIEERLKSLNEYGDEWANKPNDLLSWLIEDAEGPELSVKFLTTRILVLNFAAIHTTSLSFTHALFHLAANPQYVQPLREEVETITKDEGWSKAALGKMRKIDSFLRECQRLDGTSIASLGRKVLKDFTFSDGTFVPKGTTIIVAARAIHRDEEFYENADTFDPFRFADLREPDGEGVKYHFVSTTNNYLPFGHGRHACPGRFFAASMLKSMLAHIVVTYDVKFADNMTYPRTLYFATTLVPDPSAKVMFRRRVD